MAQKDILIKNFKEYYDLAEYAFKNKKYNGAVTLYHKALVELCDLSLLESSGKVGVNHIERFNLLRVNNPKLYEIASKLFGFYRDSYSNNISETIAKEVRQRVADARRQIIKETNT